MTKTAKSENANTESAGTVLLEARIVSQNGGVIVAEYYEDGIPVRVIVPAGTVENGYALEDDLTAGIRVSVDWRRVVKLEATPEKIAVALYDAGIYTFEDLKRNPNGAIGAIQRAYGFDYAALLLAADSQKER